MALPSADPESRPEVFNPNVSDPRFVPDVEWWLRGETPGNRTRISEAAQTGRLEREVRATPREDYDRVSRGEQNRLRPSDVDVREGNPIVRTQEVMLPIQIGKLGGETEILRIKEEGAELLGNETRKISRVGFEEPRGNSEQSELFQESKSRERLEGITAEILRTEVTVQNEGPRPGCSQVDQRPCQPELPLKAIGASVGKTVPLRTVSISRTMDIEKIWEDAERRLGACRSHFSLVRSGSRYVPTEGQLDDPEQLFEIRWRGRVGNPVSKEIQVTLGQDTWRERRPLETTVQELPDQIGCKTSEDRTVRIGGCVLKGTLWEEGKYDLAGTFSEKMKIWRLIFTMTKRNTHVMSRTERNNREVMIGRRRFKNRILNQSRKCEDQSKSRLRVQSGWRS
jgi:hypothetical protein